MLQRKRRGPGKNFHPRREVVRHQEPSRQRLANPERRLILTYSFFKESPPATLVQGLTPWCRNPTSHRDFVPNAESRFGCHSETVMAIRWIRQKVRCLLTGPYSESYALRNLQATRTSPSEFPRQARLKSVPQAASYPSEEMPEGYVTRIRDANRRKKEPNNKAGPILNLDNELYPAPCCMANEFRENSQEETPPAHVLAPIAKKRRLLDLNRVDSKNVGSLERFPFEFAHILGTWGARTPPATHDRLSCDRSHLRRGDSQRARWWDVISDFRFEGALCRDDRPARLRGRRPRLHRSERTCRSRWQERRHG